MSLSGCMQPLAWALCADGCSPVRRDSLLLDCVPLSQGSKVPECFVEGLTVVDECKPAESTGSSLEQLLSAGNATDGVEGSLCSLVPTSDKVRPSILFLCCSQY